MDLAYRECEQPSPAAPCTGTRPHRDPELRGSAVWARGRGARSRRLPGLPHAGITLVVACGRLSDPTDSVSAQAAVSLLGRQLCCPPGSQSAVPRRCPLPCNEETQSVPGPGEPGLPRDSHHRRCQSKPPQPPASAAAPPWSAGHAPTQSPTGRPEGCQCWHLWRATSPCNVLAPCYR